MFYLQPDESLVYIKYFSLYFSSFGVQKHIRNSNCPGESTVFHWVYGRGVSCECRRKGHFICPLCPNRYWWERKRGETENKIYVAVLMPVLYPCIWYMYYGETRFPKELTFIGFSPIMKKKVNLHVFKNYYLFNNWREPESKYAVKA